MHVPPHQQADSGIIALSRGQRATADVDLGQITKLIEVDSPTFAAVDDDASIAVWGLTAQRVGDAAVYPLSRGARRRDEDLDPETLSELLTGGDRSGLNDVLPPFAAIRASTDGGVTAATDAMGARHVYYASGADWSAISTSAEALARAARSSIDLEAAAIQCQLGWQVGTRTLFEGVHKLDAGTTATLNAGRLHSESYAANDPKPIGLEEAVRSAASMLRDYLEKYLDDHPDATLQLTGGQDSRLLLSAIPPSRRHGLSVMTLRVPGSADADIAAQLAERYRMRHHVITLDGLDEWSNSEAHDAVAEASRRLGGMADPLALAALVFAESKIGQGPRLSGLGGEVARGFYYILPWLKIPSTRRTTSLLSSWRMFANESVANEALDEEFGKWARPFATAEIYGLLSVDPADLRSSSDDFYLSQRMQRWAGVTDSAICLDREVVNPMLDRRFLEIAIGLEPSDKKNSRFLSRLQVELDEELAQVPLDGRPTPTAYATRSAAGAAARSASFAQRVLRKSKQRVRGNRLPPAGGDVLAAKGGRILARAPRGHRPAHGGWHHASFLG